MNEYFEGAIRQLQARARHLVSLIPRNLERDVDTLAIRCRDCIDDVIARLESLLSAPAMRDPKNQGIRVRRFRRALDELDLLESVAVAALHRWGEADRRMNRLTHHIAREIRYPLITPVVVCLSPWRDYYLTYSHLNLLCVPLAQHQFLLHLPDLYHELAHPLLSVSNDPQVEPFQQAYAEALNAAHAYLAVEMQQERRNTRGPQVYRQYLATWLDCWEDWLIEFFCDLFAAFTVGSAYGWGHFHLHVGRGGDPFSVPKQSPTEHPADAARMDVIIRALSRVGFSQDATAIQSRWQQLLNTIRAGETAEYRRCFPETLLETIVDKAHQGIQALGCQLAQPGMQEPIRKLLNDAWTEFWQAPSGYVAWEKTEADKLGKLLGG